ncbi:MAG: glycosyltransferase family 2 protein [Humibacillus sp.]
MSNAPFVSVIFPTYNRRDVVQRTLEHLLRQDHPHDRFEIIVADNSSDSTPDMVRELAESADVRIVLQASDERLPAVKRNHALRSAEGELVVFMNDDVWVGPDFLSRHVTAHAAQADPVAVLGLVEQSGQMPQTAFTEWYQPFAYGEIADRGGAEVSYRYHWSMNLSLPKAVMLERNLVFHEDWSEIGHEDIELGYRWTRAGYRVVFEPRAWGEHFHPHDLASACRLQASIGRGLRDLEVLIPEPDLLERYGVLSRRSSWWGRVRMGVRTVLFNRFTVPLLQPRLERVDRRARLAEWTYWKVMLHHTQHAYRTTTPRHPVPTATTPGVST